MTFTNASVEIQAAKSVVFRFAVLRDPFFDAFMSAKYFFSPGKFFTFTCAGYGKESERTVPLVIDLYFRSVSSVKLPGFPPNGSFALSCAMAPISWVVTLSVCEIRTAWGVSRWSWATYGE